MYRAVALACVRRGVDVEDPQKVLDVAKQSMVSFQRKSDGLHTLLDNDDVTDEVRFVGTCLTESRELTNSFLCNRYGQWKSIRK